MVVDQRQALSAIKRFDQLIAYLRDELGWPISKDSFDDVDDLFYDFSAEELGIDPKTAAKIQEIKRLRPLSAKQPWGIFFVKFEPKKLPIVALRRILGQVARKKRASSNSSERTAWSADDLLFISNYGEGDERQISFAHFSQSTLSADLPTLRVLGWNNLDTPLHLDAVAAELTNNLRWPEDDDDLELWRKSWSSAFKLGHNEVINTAKDLSIRLAELASNIRDRIKTTLSIESESGPLTKLMKAFQTSLIHDLDNDGFADMYAQTIAYGLLSARISDPTKKTVDDFTAHMRTSPFLRELLQTFLHIGGRKGKAGRPGIDFDELGVSDVIQLLDRSNMEAIILDFGDRNRQEDPVMHFFEGFLHAYDSKIRKDRGVFYTPQPVVSYIVRSVHETLKIEFGLADGLADITTWREMLKRNPLLKLPLLSDEQGEDRSISLDDHFVQILDPATGTATFIVEVIEVVYQTLKAKWEKNKLSEKDQIESWNMYVPTHLLPRLYAFELMMAPYAIAHMKIGLKLAETGYSFRTEERARIYLTNALEPWHRELPLIGFNALAHEALAVNEVKKNKRFTVIIGNPPYAGHSVNNHIPSIVQSIKDYKKGFPELDRPGQGKWLQDDYVKFIRLSEQLLSTVTFGVLGFITNHSFLDNPTFKGMRKHLMESFSRISITDLHGNSKKKDDAPNGVKNENVFDIQQGVAVMLAGRGTKSEGINGFDLFGDRASKYDWLKKHYAISEGSRIDPKPPLFLFKAVDKGLAVEYESGISIKDLMNQNGEPAPGFVTTQDEFAISWTKQEAIEKVKTFLGTKNEVEARSIFKLCSQDQWNYERAKTALSKESWQNSITKVLYRPFDYRWTVWNSNVTVHRRERVMRHMQDQANLALICTRQTKDQWGVFVTRNIAAHKTCGAYDINFLFPLYLNPHESSLDLLGGNRIINFSPSIIKQIGKCLGVEIKGGILFEISSEDLFGYMYAIFNSSSYRQRYSEFLKTDFPRLPITHNLALFKQLSLLGKEVISLHLLESTSLPDEIRGINLQGDLMVDKAIWSENTIWINKSRTIGFKDVSSDVWNFHIGGYQVCEKWLKDRKGRHLTKLEVEQYMKIINSISSTLSLMKKIDLAIDSHGGWPTAFIDQ